MSRIVTFVGGQKKLAAPASVVTLWRKHATQVDACYALGTAQHETNFATNEQDVEESGYVSMGIFQIGEDEMTQVGMPIASHDPYDLEESTIVMVDLAEWRLSRIEARVAGLSFDHTDLWAYLSIAHNQGLGACLKTIATHGVAWQKYKDRNLEEAQQALDEAVAAGSPALIAAAKAKLNWWENVFAYGDDCISGGAYRSILT